MSIMAQIEYAFMLDPLFSIGVAFTLGAVFAALVLATFRLAGVSSARDGE